MNLDNLNLRVDDHDSSCETKRSQRIQALILGKDGLTIDSEHEEVDEYGLRCCQERPASKYFEVEAAVSLTFRV